MAAARGQSVCRRRYDLLGIGTACWLLQSVHAGARLRMFSKLPEADRQANLREAPREEFDRINHAHMKLRAPMREERAGRPLGKAKALRGARTGGPQGSPRQFPAVGAAHIPISRPSCGIVTSPSRVRSRLTAPHSTAWLLLTTGLPSAASSSSIASIWVVLVQLKK
jgi:hypothetical protein